MNKLVLEYHYESGDIGAYFIEPQDDLQVLIESAFAETNTSDKLVNILIRRENEDYMTTFEHGWQQTNSELTHKSSCVAGVDPTHRCTCGAWELSQGLCAWCADSKIPLIEKEPATHYYRDNSGTLFGLCDDDAKLMLEDDAVEPENKKEYNSNGELKVITL